MVMSLLLSFQHQANVFRIFFFFFFCLHDFLKAVASSRFRNSDAYCHLLDTMAGCLMRQTTGFFFFFKMKATLNILGISQELLNNRDTLEYYETLTGN